MEFKIIIKYNQRTRIMSKRVNHHQKEYFSQHNNEQQKYVSKVEPRKYKQNNLEWVGANDFQSETHRFATQNNQYKKDTDADRLDLIFKKEPKDIQQKLMKLLISYNAVMKYNKDSDMFEVDLLLPFLNEEQKRQFVKQFLQVRRNGSLEAQPQEQESRTEEHNEQNDENLYCSKQLKKFSFNLKQNTNLQDQFASFSQKNEEFPFNNQHKPKEQIFDESAENLSGTGGFYETIPKEQIKVPHKDGLNYKQIDSVIAMRLNNAINVIKKRKNQERNFQYNISMQNISKPVSEDTSKQQQSIIDQISNPSFNQTQNVSDYKQLSVSQYIKDDQQILSREIKSNKEPHNTNRYHEEEHYASLQKDYMQIVEQPYQEQDYEPLFNKNKPQNNLNNDKNKRMISFEDYTKKLGNKTDKKKPTNVNQKLIDEHAKKNKNIKNQVHTPKTYESTKIYSAQNSKSKQSLKCQHYLSKKSTSIHNNNKNRSISKESRKLQSQIQQFFNTHTKKMAALYSEINDKIKQRSHQVDLHQVYEKPQKLLEKLYILVQDEPQDEEDREVKQIPQQNQSTYFKEQILKQYHKQILVNNSNLSSQELVKYFKFLHSNAKRIYIKYLQNKDK